jgi:thiosulfate/3-mercaptopyruvate sulfurtransferase
MIRTLRHAAVALAALAGAAPAAAQEARDARLPSMLVPSSWLAEHLGDSGLVVVHVAHARQAAAFDTAHVPGARLLRYDRIAGDVGGVAVELLTPERVRDAFAELGVGDGSRVVLVGEPMSAARAWMTLDWLGLGDRAAVLDGGLAAWRAGGHPLSRERPAAVAPATLTIRPQPERLVDAAWVRARLADPKVALVDARPTEEYTGADGGHMHLLAGHIPGARNLYWERLTVSRDDPRFRPASELRALFEQAGATPDRTVVTYCMIGMRASVTYFVSRLLGYETRFYDGSWDDWSRRGFPAVRGAEPGAPGTPDAR